MDATSKDDAKCDARSPDPGNLKTSLMGNSLCLSDRKFKIKNIQRPKHDAFRPTSL